MDLRWLDSLPGSAGWYAASRLIFANLETVGAVIRKEVASAPPPVADAPTADEIPSVAELGTDDRVLAEIDQDGFAFAVHPADVRFFDRRVKKLPKLRYQLHVVLHHGTVCVRKRFRRQDPRATLGVRFWSRLGLPFCTEAAALLRLQNQPCAPRLRDIHLASQTIYMDYIRGQTLQHRYAKLDDKLLDMDVGHISEIDDPDRDRREAHVFARHADDELRTAIAAVIRSMNECGVAPLDVKLGNILVGERTEALYWIDFERASLASFPRYTECLARQRRLADRWFGLSISLENGE